MSAHPRRKAPFHPTDRIAIGDPRYPTMVRGFNLRWVGRPKYVEVCRDARHVARAVQAALDQGLRITVRSGGHCYEDFVSSNDGGAILDISPMRGVHRDEATGLYGVEAGATLWDVYVQLYKGFGVTLPGGSCSSVGAGGHVIGAGYGLLSRRDGLTIDYLHAVELVHVTTGRRARIRTLRRNARDPLEREMLWAHLGGGGGNFGIVTRFWFKDLPRAPREAYLLDLSWPWAGLERADLARIVRAYGDFFAANSGVGSPFKDLSASLGIPHRSSGSVDVNAQYVGDRPSLLDDFAAALDRALPRRGGGAKVRKLPWLFAAQTSNSPGPNQYSKHKSAYMVRPFPERQIEVIWDFVTAQNYENPSASLAVNAYGGQVNAVDPAATAYPHRSSILKLQYHTYWNHPADEGANLRWVRGFYQAMYGPRGPFPDETFDGCFVNYPDVDLEDWQYLYYKDNYPRLREVKARLDPLDIFHHRQSIELLAR